MSWMWPLKRGIFWRKDFTRFSLMETASGDELKFMAKIGTVGTGCTDLLWRKFYNESERGRQGTWYGVARSSRERRDGDDGSGWLSAITWCHRWTLLAWTLMSMQQLSNPVGYSRLHTLAHVAVDHETVVCNLLIPNGTTDHTKLAAV
jgi:hypothetical protein